MYKLYIGQGIKFPHAVNDKGAIALENNEKLVRQSIQRILQQETGEAFMQETFGVNLSDYQFEQNDDILFSLIESEVVTAIEQWEKRIIPESLTIEFAKVTIESLDIVINYKIINIAEPQAYIYPFYRQLKY